MAIDTTSLTSTTTTTSTSTSSSATTTSDAVISSDFETFLKMLSTQLQNQDPLNPVDSSDYAVQLATFSSVEQQVLTNDLLESLIGQMNAAGMADLAGWVGMEARSTAPAYYEGDPVQIAYEADVDAEEALMVVYNAAGTAVAAFEVDPNAEITSWDGTDNSGSALAHGSYTFEIQSYVDGELTASATAESYSPITEARLQDGETVLVTNGGQEIASTEITALRAPQ